MDTVWSGVNCFTRENGAQCFFLCPALGGVAVNATQKLFYNHVIILLVCQVGDARKQQTRTSGNCAAGFLCVSHGLEAPASVENTLTEYRGPYTSPFPSDLAYGGLCLS